MIPAEEPLQEERPPVEEIPAQRIPTADPAIRVRGLSKRFGATMAVSDVGFDLYAGEALALVGSNGAGKTTTLRMLATLLPPDSGEAHVCGRSIREPFGVRPLLGFMPDVLGVYPEMLVREYLEFFARAYQIAEHHIAYCMQEVSAFAGLQGLMDAPCAGLSRGMLQRVALGRALLHDPPVLLLDEPAAGLDPRSRAEFRHMLLELRRKGKTIVISSHVLSDLEDTCTRIVVIDQGRLLVNEAMDVFLERARGARTFRVAANGGGAKAYAELSARADVSSVRWDGETVLFDLPYQTGRGAEVLRGLIAAGVDVEEFGEVPFSLEQAYLARTGRVS